MKKLLIIIFLLIGFSSAFADVKEILVVCSEWNNYTNKDGTGAYWEILKSVYEPVGIKVKTMTMPWKRAVSKTKSKKVDAIVGVYYEANATDFLYPKWHISVEDPVVAIFKKGNITNWHSLGIKSLEGKKVVWIRGYDFNLNLLKGIGAFKQEITKISQGLKLIERGRADVFLDYETDIKHEAMNLNFNLDKDYEIKEAKIGNKLYVAFAKTEKSKDLIGIFDNKMALLSKTGEIEKIYVKWGFGVKKFDKNGAFIRSIGRSGQGPGNVSRVRNRTGHNRNKLD